MLQPGRSTRRTGTRSFCPPGVEFNVLGTDGRLTAGRGPFLRRGLGSNNWAVMGKLPNRIQTNVVTKSNQTWDLAAKCRNYQEASRFLV